VKKDRFCYVCGKPSSGRQCRECYKSKHGASLSRQSIQRRHNYSKYVFKKP